MRAPPWFDELTPQPGPPWHPMGTRALPVGDGAPFGLSRVGEPALLARKAELLRVAHDVVAARVPGPSTDAAEAEVAAQLGAATFEDAARLVVEDLCVLVSRDGRWRLDAGVVCFPSVWRIADKIGLPITDVHGPVPAYADELAVRVERLLDRLRPERPVWRRNWFVHDSDELHLPDSPPPPPTAVAVPDGLWLRSERQTLHRLHRTGAILFTIHTDQAPLGVVADRPALAAALAASIRAWSPDLVAYRGAAAWRPAALTWLASVPPR